MKKCVRCQLNFQTWNLWLDHTQRDGCARTIKPERTTDRTKEQIRDDAEGTWLKPFIVVSNFQYPDKKQIREAVEKVLPKPRQESNPYSNFMKRLGKELAASKEAKSEKNASVVEPLIDSSIVGFGGTPDIPWGPDCDKLSANTRTNKAGVQKPS